jgi:hypothetical protein
MQHADIRSVAREPRGDDGDLAASLCGHLKWPRFFRRGQQARHRGGCVACDDERGAGEAPAPDQQSALVDRDHEIVRIEQAVALRHPFERLLQPSAPLACFRRFLETFLLGELRHPLLDAGEDEVGVVDDRRDEAMQALPMSARNAPFTRSELGERAPLAASRLRAAVDR